MRPYKQITIIRDDHPSPHLGPLLRKLREESEYKRTEVSRIVWTVFGEKLTVSMLTKIESGETRSMLDRHVRMLLTLYRYPYELLPIEKDDTDYEKVYIENGIIIRLHK